MSRDSVRLLGADDAGISRGVDFLRAGQLVAFPTETVYGLGADAANAEAVNRVFAAKGRPTNHPLIVHISGASELGRWSTTKSPVAHLLATTFWPGPLTLLVPRSDLVASETVGGRTMVGLRVPDHPVALELLHQFDSGIAAPSANRFGGISPTTAAHVVDDLGSSIAGVIDGGACHVGVESTIVEVSDEAVTLLRPGAITTGMIEELLGPDVRVVDGTAGPSMAPGMLESHYAPTKVTQLVTEAELFEVLCTKMISGKRVGVIAPFEVDHEQSWALPPDVEGYARNLYSCLRLADESSGTDELIVVTPNEQTSSDALYVAVLDRLTKASS